MLISDVLLYERDIKFQRTGRGLRPSEKKALVLKKLDELKTNKK